MSFQDVALEGPKVQITGMLFDQEDRPFEKLILHILDSRNTHLQSVKTNSNGSFTADLQVEKLGDQKLIFQIFKETKVANEVPELASDPKLVEDLKFLRDRKEVGLGVVDAMLRGKVDLGFLKITRFSEKEEVSWVYMARIISATITPKLIGAWNWFKEKVDFWNNHSAFDIQASFDVESVDLTWENTWKLLTNGICPIYWKREGDLLVAEINWDRYELDKLQSLPNIRIYRKPSDPKSNEVPELVKIETQFRTCLDPSKNSEDKEDVQTYRMGDDDFETGLRKVNSACAVFAQTVFHLSFSHVYEIEVAQAAVDYLPNTKLGELLIPMVEYLRKISRELGKDAIFGEGGALDVSALSVKGIAKLISDSVASIDPFSFRPRGPLYKDHHFAKVNIRHYEMVREKVGQFFDENWDEIQGNEWIQIHHFFKRLHKRSPIHRPWAGEKDPTVWEDGNEIGGLADGSLPERTKAKESDRGVHSFRPVAQDPHGPIKSDREMIERFVADLIFRVTMWHSWIHRSQHTEILGTPSVLDQNFAPMCLEDFGEDFFGGMTEENVNKILQNLFTFGNFNVDEYALIGNEEVYKPLREGVKDNADYYAKHGIDADEIQYSTVI